MEDIMRDYFKGITSALAPDRDRLVRSIANWLCHVRDTGHCRRHGWTTAVLNCPDRDNVYVFVTSDKSDSKLFEAANQAVPRKYRNLEYRVIELGTRRKPTDFVSK